MPICVCGVWTFSRGSLPSPVSSVVESGLQWGVNTARSWTMRRARSARETVRTPSDSAGGELLQKQGPPIMGVGVSQSSCSPVLAVSQSSLVQPPTFPESSSKMAL